METILWVTLSLVLMGMVTEVTTLSFEQILANLTSIPTDIDSSVTSITLSSNLLTNLNQGSFTRFANLTNLLLDENRIRQINSQAFSGTSITVLNLNKNRLQSFPDLNEIGSTLTTLKIAKNGITTLGENITSGITLNVLETLTLKDNPLVDISGICNISDYLTNINLDKTLVNNITNETFADCLNLQSLSLSGSSLTSFPVLDSIGPQLMSLYLDNTAIATLPLERLEVLTSLIRISLSGLALEAFPSNLTVLGDTLTSLYLGRNGLDYIPPEFFSHFYQLKIINLISNQFTSVPDFNQLPANNSLYKLYLSKNLIDTVITGNEFDNLPGLTHLYLSRNRIPEIEGFGQPSPGLLRVDIDRNRLRSLATTFENTTSLQRVTLNNNLLTDFPNLISANNSITNIKLDGNAISDEAFENAMPMLGQLTKLSLLYLAYNNIVEPPNLQVISPPLDLVDLSGNPLFCNCSLQWVKDAAMTSSPTVTLSIYPCDTPGNLASVSWTQIRTDMLCPVDSAGTVSILSSMMNESTALSVVDDDNKTCAETGLEHAPWWMIIFPTARNITGITIQGDGLYNLGVSVGELYPQFGIDDLSVFAWDHRGLPCTKKRNMQLSSQAQILTCHTPVFGNFVRLEASTDPLSYIRLTLCEISLN